MDYYIDVHIVPDAYIRQNTLLNKVYSELHKTLWDLRSSNIGISFPRWKIILGDTIRIHSSRLKLEQLQSINWLSSLRDHCLVKEIERVPSNVFFRIISRRQPTMSMSKLQRLIKRNSEIDVKEYKAKMFGNGLDNPYIELVSGSNGHKHRRYIEFGPLLKEPTFGLFDQFGLSKTATIPWF